MIFVFKSIIFILKLVFGTEKLSSAAALSWAENNFDEIQHE